MDGFAGTGPVFGRQDPSCGREAWAGDFASDRARSDSHLGIVPHAFVFPGVAASHHIELVVLFSKPDWGYRGTTPAKRSETDVLLALNFARDRHGDIVRERQQGGVSEGKCADGLGTFVTAYVARGAAGVLQARDAQMDERAPEAPQEGAGEGGN